MKAEMDPASKREAATLLTEDTNRRELDNKS